MQGRLQGSVRAARDSRRVILHPELQRGVPTETGSRGNEVIPSRGEPGARLGSITRPHSAAAWAAEPGGWGGVQLPDPRPVGLPLEVPLKEPLKIKTRECLAALLYGRGRAAVRLTSEDSGFAS